MRRIEDGEAMTRVLQWIALAVAVCTALGVADGVIAEERNQDRPAVVAALPRAEAGANQEQEARIASATIALAAITALLAIFTGALWKATYDLSRDAKASAANQREDLKASILEANRAATAMEGLAKSMERSANAASESVAAVKQRTAQQMRAYLSVTTGIAIYQDRARNLRFEAKPVLTNAGHTPARRLAYWAKADVLPFPLPDNFVLPVGHPPEQRSVDLAPHQTVELNATVDGFYEDASVPVIKRGVERRLYVWGVVSYVDVFGEDHHTQFAQSYAWLGPENSESILGTYLFRHNEAT